MIRNLGQTLVLTAIDGTITALFAIGIALLFRGTRSVNFALGEIAALSLYGFTFVTDKGLPILFALLGALVVGVGVTLGFEATIVRRIPTRDRTSVTVATVGLVSFVLAVEVKFFGESPERVAPPLTGNAFTAFDIAVSKTNVIAMVVLAAATVGLTGVLRRTDFGLGVLAVAQDRDASRLMGVPAARVSMFLWGIGAVLAVLAGYLVVPAIGQLRPAVFGGIYTKALIGAVVGGLDRITGAVAGAFVVTFLDQLIVRNLDISWLPGESWVFLFLAVLAVLVVRPTGLLAGLRIRGAA